MSLSLELEGLETTMGRLRGLGDRGRTAMKRALNDEANDILRASKMIVPVRTGYLKSTGRAKPMETGPGEVKVLIQYTAAYAKVVHERNLDYTEGRWKYLQEPLEAAESGYTDRIARRYADHMRALGRG